MSRVLWFALLMLVTTASHSSVQAGWTDGDPDAGVMDEETGQIWYVSPVPFPDPEDYQPQDDDHDGDGGGGDEEKDWGHGKVLDPPCRLIFSINPGRSGSGYLAQLLSLDKWVDVGHERQPTMFGGVLRRAKHEGLDSTYSLRRALKLSRMRHVAKHQRIHDSAEGDPTSPGGWKIYAETSHAFIKTFWDVVMDEFLEDEDTGQQCRIDVVVLRRPLYEVACSLYRRNWTRIHGDWLIEPGSALGSLPELQIEGVPNRQVQEMGAVLWYIYDTEVKAQQFWERYGLHPNVKIHEVRLEDLQTPRGVDALFAALDLRRGRGTSNDSELDRWLRRKGLALDLPPDHSADIIGNEHNANAPAVERRIPCTREFVEDRVQALKEAAGRAGVQLPRMRMYKK